MLATETQVSYVRWIAAACAAVVLLLAAWAAADVLFLLFGCILFAQPLAAAADFVSSRTRISRGAALSLVLVTTAAICFLVGWMVAGRIADQTRDLADTLPKAVRQLGDKLQQNEWGQRALNAFNNFRSGLENREILGRATGVFSSSAGLIAKFYILLFGTLFIAADPGLYKRGLIRLFPPDHRERIDDALSEAGATLRAWLLGKLLLMGYVAAVTMIGLSLLGVPMAITLGLFAGLADFVPNFGPLAAFIPAGLIALTIHPMMVVWVGLLYYGAQVSENYVLTPIVQRRVSKLAAAVIIFSQVILGVLFGAQAVLFAEPLAAAGQVLIKKLYVDTLEEGSQ